MKRRQVKEARENWGRNNWAPGSWDEEGNVFDEDGGWRDLTWQEAYEWVAAHNLYNGDVHNFQNMQEGDTILPSNAWPGLYQIVYYDSQGEIMHPDTANEELFNADAERRPVYADGYPEGPTIQDFEGREIESDYGDPDEEQQERTMKRRQIREQRSDFEVEYYLRVGQHGGFAVGSYEEGVERAMEMAEEMRQDPEEEWYVGVSPFGDENRFAIAFITQDYLDYVQSLGDKAFNTDTNSQLWLDAAEESLRTGELVEGEYQDDSQQENTMKRRTRIQEQAVTADALYKWMVKNAGTPPELANQFRIPLDLARALHRLGMTLLPADPARFRSEATATIGNYKRIGSQQYKESRSMADKLIQRVVRGERVEKVVEAVRK